MTDRGYTLIELTVVVLLIGMMLLISVPRVRDSLLADDLNAAARHLAGASWELRNEAIREQVDYILSLDLSHPGFWVYSADTTPEKLVEIRKEAIRFPNGVKIADFSQPGEAKKTEGEVDLRFYRKGYVEPAVVHLTKDDRTFTIVFHPFFNKVSVYEKYADFTFNEEGRTSGL